MPDVDETLEMLLREHLNAELNGQLGRPAAAFLAHAVDATHTNGSGGETHPSVAQSICPPTTPEGRFGPFHSNKLNSGWFNSWFIGMAGAALAASIAALWAAPAAFRGHGPVIPIRAIQPDVTPRPPEIAKSNVGTSDGSGTTDLADLPAQSPLIQWVQSRTLDEGTVVLDDPDHPVPARKLRQQQLEHTQWYDAAKRTRVEMTVPRENIKFVEMDTY